MSPNVNIYKYLLSKQFLGQDSIVNNALYPNEATMQKTNKNIKSSKRRLSPFTKTFVNNLKLTLQFTKTNETDKQTTLEGLSHCNSWLHMRACYRLLNKTFNATCC